MFGSYERDVRLSAGGSGRKEEEGGKRADAKRQAGSRKEEEQRILPGPNRVRVRCDDD